MAQSAHIIREGLLQDAHNYARRCDEELQQRAQEWHAYVQQEQDAAVRYRHQTELYYQACTAQEQKMKTVEQSAELCRQQLHHTEHIAQNAVENAQQGTRQLAEMVMAQKTEVEVANRALHETRKSEENALSYYLASSKQEQSRRTLHFARLLWLEERWNKTTS